MALKHHDPGGSATGGLEFWSSTAGSVTAQTTTTHGQAYAYEYSTGSPSATCNSRKNGILQAAGNRISRYFRVAALPGTGVDTAVTVLAANPSAGASLLNVVLDSAGKLRLYTNGTTTLLKTGTTVLTAGQWPRVTLSYAITTTTNWSAKVYIDGVLEYTATNADGTLSSASPADLLIALTSSLAANFLMQASDIHVDDGTDQADPAAGVGNGELRVGRRAVTTVSSGAWDTTVGTGSLNERPVNTANRIAELATGPATVHYNVEGVAAGDADLTGATILGRSVFAWFTLSSLTSTPTGKLQIDGSPIGAVMDPAVANTYQLHHAIDTGTAYPSTVGASSSGIAADTLLAELGAIVSYVPAGGPATFTATAAPSVTATLAPNTSLEVGVASATLSVTATLAPTTVAQVATSSSLSVTAILTPTANVAKDASSSLSVTATLAPVAIDAAQASSSMSVTAALALTTLALVGASSAPAVTATLAALSATTFTASSSLSVVATLAPAAVRAVQAISDLTVTATLAPVALEVELAAAPLSVTATLASTAVEVGVATAPMSITATLAPTANVAKSASASPAVVATMSPTSTGVALASSSPSVVATLAPTVVAARPASAALSVTATLLPELAGSATVTASPTVTAALTPTAVRVVPISSSMSVLATLAPEAVVVAQGSSSMSVTATMTPTSTASTEADAALLVMVQLMPTALVAVQADVAMTVIATMMPVALGPGEGVGVFDPSAVWGTSRRPTAVLSGPRRSAALGTGRRPIADWEER